MPLPLLPTAELDLTKTDKPTLLYRAQVLAQQVIEGWSDFTLNHIENVVLEGASHMVAMGVSVMNERIRQFSLATLSDRLAAIRKGRNVNYRLMGPTAAQVDGAFSMASGAAATVQVTLPEGLRLQSGDSVYRLVAASTVDVGNVSSAEVTLENAEEEQSVHQSDEVPNIMIDLPDTDVIDASLYLTGAVVAGQGAFSCYNADGALLRSFAEVGPDDLAFIPLLDNNGRAYIAFGNGINGAIPLGTITVAYKTGGGLDGRVTAGADWKVLEPVYDVDGNPVTVTFANTENSTGGLDATTVEEARIQIPQAARNFERCVNEDDFEYVATTIAGVALAGVMTSNHDASIPENVARLYPVAYGAPYSDSEYYPPATPTEAQKSAIEAAVARAGTHPKLMKFTVGVYDPNFLTVNVEVRVYKEANATAASVKSAITQAVQKHFAIATNRRARQTWIDFGFKLLDNDGDPDYKLIWSAVHRAINDADGVREISHATNGLLLNGVRSSLIMQPREIPAVGTITVYDMDQSGVEI
jgi:hypothetical protein